MAKLIAKYRIDCDPPGMQIAGAGGLDGQRGSSMIPPGTIVRLPADFEPRACMTPMNEAAKKAFEKKREKVKRDWTESLAKGETPEGQTLDQDIAPKNDKDLAAFVDKMVRKVGPNKPKTTQPSLVKRDRPRLTRDMLRTEQPEPVPDPIDADDSDDDMLPEQAQRRPAPNRNSRASEQQS